MNWCEVAPYADVGYRAGGYVLLVYMAGSARAGYGRTKFSKVKFSRFIKYPRKPRCLYSSKISSHTVILVACLFVVRYELYSIELAMFYNRI